MNNLKNVVLKIAVALLRVAYVPHKLFPTHKKVLFLSRQRNSPTDEIEFLLEKVKRIDPAIEIVCITKMIPQGIVAKIGYCFHLVFIELHHIATAKLVLLDGYSIPVSVLHHKSDLRVVQIWHALGIFKKFGKMVAGEDEGYSPAIVDTMRMHANYDYILCSSNFCIPFYAQAFGYPESSVKVFPLPRAELLQNTNYMQTKRKHIFSYYPELAERKTVLYAPTLRKKRDSKQYVQDLRNALDGAEYNLVVKLHPTEAQGLSSSTVLTCPEFTSMELLSVADYVITDYSALVFEAAQAGVPFYLYAYDIEDYEKERGFCIDYRSEMPVPPAITAQDVVAQLEAGLCTQQALGKLCKKYVAPSLHATEEIARFVVDLCNNSNY